MQTPPQSKTDLLLQIARQGPLRARDLQRAGISRTYLTRLCDRGLLERVDRGLYRLVEGPVTENSSLADVISRAPHAVICLLSALQLHDMTSEAPHAVWIMIDRHARMPRMATPRIEVVRASGAARLHGTETRVIDGLEITITTPAKTVADCFRFRRHVGLEVALEALRDYRKNRKGTIDTLIEAARADRIYAFMRPYLEALA
ncbi:type IV toxin-antitoxin system AbiEi family antitoxin domain-containing protein [Myxococcota bacterium]|nr:type IV toxin-antitoxin system AbiEi family antitoxin domain-containing protein [Myxococcota bacterium]MBU1535234.1 type IV toxin-antitoxin system AbiEi family antitoxin domain-containing protein [Myxococcota bacterium]